MRLLSYIAKEEDDIVSQSLKLEEPPTGNEESDDNISDALSKLTKAIEIQTKKVKKAEKNDDEDLDNQTSILYDLIDKQKRWKEEMDDDKSNKKEEPIEGKEEPIE